MDYLEGLVGFGWLLAFPSFDLMVEIAVCLCKHKINTIN